MSKNKPIDLVLSLLQKLTPREIARVRKAMQEEELTACQRLGHSYKPAKTTLAWFQPPKITMVCSKCGDSYDV